MRSVESSIEENVRFLDEVSERSISPHPKFDSYLTKHDKFNHNDRPSKLICEDCDKTCTHAAMLVSHKKQNTIFTFVQGVTLSFMEEKRLMTIMRRSIVNFKYLFLLS